MHASRVRSDKLMQAGCVCLGNFMQAGRLCSDKMRSKGKVKKRADSINETSPFFI